MLRRARAGLQAEQGKADMEKQILDLQGEKKELENLLAASKAKCEEIERREAERRAVEVSAVSFESTLELFYRPRRPSCPPRRDLTRFFGLLQQRKHDEELSLIKRTSQQLKAQLESILAPSKK